MAGVVCSPPPRLSAHILRWSVRDRRGLMEITAWGEGVNVGAPPPPRGIAHRLPKSARDNTGWVHRHAPSLLASTPLRIQILYFLGYISNKSQGRASRIFSTHACDIYSPIGKNWHLKSWIRRNIGLVWMICCQYGCVICALTRPLYGEYVFGTLICLCTRGSSWNISLIEKKNHRKKEVFDLKSTKGQDTLETMATVFKS